MLHHVGDWERAIGESARVLRRGGRMIGYDLLSMRTTEAVHRITHEHGERLIRRGQLEPVLRELPVTDVHVRESGPLVRFRATVARLQSAP
jgi:ubiquinone/menaquinone biosynthesis C-methylase UbiE